MQICGNVNSHWNRKTYCTSIIIFKYCPLCGHNLREPIKEDYDLLEKELQDTAKAVK